MAKASEGNWWKVLPCHLSEEWDLQRGINLDIRKLKQSVDWDLEDLPKFMPIENLLYRAFLEVAPETYLMKERSSPEAALKYLQSAENMLEELWRDDQRAQDSYRLVINAFRMWLYNDGKFKESAKIDELNGTLKKLSDVVGLTSTPQIDAVRATALTRHGKYEEAIVTLERALENPQYAQTKSWLLWKALLLDRRARDASDKRMMTMSDKEKNEYMDLRRFLERLVAKYPECARPKAYLGRCLYDLNEIGSGLREVREALSLDPGDRDLSLTCATVLRLGGYYKQSKFILEKIEGKSAEVLYQLALIYRHMATIDPSEGRRNYSIREAHRYVTDAVRLDRNHVQANFTMAELTVELNRIPEAKTLFRDLITGKDMTPGQLFDSRCRVNNNPALRRIFGADEILNNAFNILLLCTEHFAQSPDSSTGKKEFLASVKAETDNAFEMLDYFSKSELFLDAKRFLSDIMFRMNDFHRASKISAQLQAVEIRARYHAEILWRHGKCLCALGDDVTAGKIANLLRDTNEEGQKCDELFADIHLMRAKSMLENHQPLFTSDQSLCEMSDIHQAIIYGSIEACHLFLTRGEDLSRHVCKEGNHTPRILADIRQCLMRKDCVHQKFQIGMQSNDGHSVKSDIKELLEITLKHPKQLDGLPHLLKTRYELLTNIREELVDFEYTFKYTCKEKWDKKCQEAAERTLVGARNLLDHTIYSYQRAVLEKHPKDTVFPIHNGDKKGNPVETKFEGYLQKYFPKAKPKIPQEIKDYIIKLQPMTDPDNNWINALSHFVNDAKHKGSDYGKTVRGTAGKLSIPFEYKKEDLVRISCCRVEAIATRLLEYVQELYESKETQPGFLLDHEQVGEQ